ncbi:MAG: cupin domain-containing protein [Lewinellaceae bacterium]|nr:cupin domain-containing protein [Lewinellaceae bacterium]
MMMRKHIPDIVAFAAGDETRIREVLHPQKDRLAITYSLAEAELDPGKASLPHRLREHSETYIILAGQGTAYVDGTPTRLRERDVLFIPAGAHQYVVNDGEDVLRFLCVVDPAWSPDDEEILLTE